MRPSIRIFGKLDAKTNAMFRLYCNLDMINAAIAIIFSFISPGAGIYFIILQNFPWL